MVWRYNDAGYGSDAKTKRGITGFIFVNRGAAISCRSKLQKVVALSSTEVEYMAIGHVIQEEFYLRMPRKGMGID